MEIYLNKVYEEYNLVQLVPNYKIIRQIAVNDGKKPFVKTIFSHLSKWLLYFKAARVMRNWDPYPYLIGM